MGNSTPERKESQEEPGDIMGGLDAISSVYIVRGAIVASKSSPPNKHQRTADDRRDWPAKEGTMPPPFVQ